jgi:hypothetical protein
VFRLPPFIWWGFYNHCNLARFLWSNNSEHSSSNYSLWLWCFKSNNLRLPVAEILIFSPITCQVLLMSTMPSKFSEAANPFPHQFFHHIKLLSCSLTPWHSLSKFATTRQWSVSQSASLKDRTSNIFECRLLSIKTWSIWLCIFPSEVQENLQMLLCGG